MAVPASYPELDAVEVSDRKYRAIDFASIDGKSFVLITETQFMQRIFNSLCLDYGVNVRTEVVVRNLETQIAMVKEGIGMACVSSEAQSLNPDSSIRFYSFTQSLPQRKVVAVWRKDVMLTSAVKDLIEIIKNFYIK